MSLGSSDMAGSVLGTAFSLLLLASIIQGQNVDVFYKKKIEAVVGQDVVLPCAMENRADLRIVSIEWSKNKEQNTKLALYSPKHGIHLFRPNVTMLIANNSMGSYLNLTGVTEWDSGIYICDLTTFPLGSIRRETELMIKDVMCDVNGNIEVHAGENVIIQCSVFSDAQYWWTKNEKLVSESKSLELLRVTDADTGIYTLTVNAGNRRLHKEFNVTVLTATTTTRTGLATVSPRSNITEDGLTKSADSSLTTSPTTVLTTTDTNVTWTISMSSDGTSSDATDDNSNISNVTLTSYTNNTQISLTSTPATHTDLYYSNNTTDQDINATHTSTFSDQSVTSNLSTTLSYGSADSVFESTQETRTNTSTLPTMQPEIDSSTSPEEADTRGSVTENSTNSNTGATTTLRNVVVTKDEGTDGAQSELLLVLIIVPVLVLIAVAAYIYRKQVIKQRMDLPPPFKPPPPPVKYTAARQSEISTQPFPTSRCNSVTQVRDLRLYEYTA